MEKSHLASFTMTMWYPTPYLLFKNSDDPQHLTFPSAIIAILSPRMSASSMKCVVSKIVLPSFCCCSKSQVNLRADGSIPEVGSSNITTCMEGYQLESSEINNIIILLFFSSESLYHLLTLESAINAIPTDNFLFIPPDNARVCVCRLSVSPTHSIILSTSCFTRCDGQLFNLAKNDKCSSTVSWSNNTSC